MMNGRFDFLYEYGDYSPEGFLPFFFFFTQSITLYVYNILPKAYD